MGVYRMKILLITLLLITGSVFADKKHHDHNPPTVVNVTEVTEVTEVTNITQSDTEGVASAIAAGQCQFDWTYSWQGCAAVGAYDGNSAAAFGVGKRYNEVLFNGTVSVEDGGEVGVGASVNWKF